LAGLTALTIFLASPVAAAAAERSLAAGRGVDVSSPAGRPTCFSFSLAAKTTARLEVDQEDVDVEVRLYRGGGSPAIVDAAQVTPEVATIVAETGAAYKACVSPVTRSGRAIRYSVRLGAARPATPGDGDLVLAERLLTEARGNPRSGVNSIRRAIRLLRGQGEPDLRVADALLQLGDALNAGGDYEGARAEYKEVQDLDPSRRTRVFAEAIANSAVASRREGDIESARAGYEQAIAILSDLEKNRPSSSLEQAIAAVNNNNGLAELDTAEYQQGLDSFLKALSAMYALGTRSDEGILLTNIALAYRYLRDYTKAEVYLRRALPLLAADKIAYGRALMNLGRLRAIQGDPGAASALLKRAATLVGDSPIAAADVGNNLGQLALRAGDFPAALKYLNAASEIYAAKHDLRDSARTWFYSGCAQAAMGHSDTAFTDLQRALDLDLSTGLADDAVATLFEVARLQRRVGKPEDSRATLSRAIVLSEKLRVRVAAPDLRATWFSSRQALYEEMADLLFEVSEGPASAAEAFGYAERSRERSLSDVLATGRRTAIAALDPELARGEERIVKALAFRTRQLERLSDSAGDEKKRATLEREADDLELRYQAIEGEIARKSARGAAIAASPLTASEVQRLLGPDTMLLEFSLGAEHSFLWVVDSQRIVWFRLPPRAAIERLARVVMELLADRARRAADPLLERRYRTSSSALSSMLLGQAAGLIEGRRLIFALDGILHYLSFEALPSPGHASTPLGIANEISRIPSATALAALRRPGVARAERPRIVVFADPVFRGDPRADSGVHTAAPGSGTLLSRLPFTLREALAIQAAATPEGVVLRTGFEATKEALSTSREAGILHIATHARIDADQPERSAIRFTETAANGTPRDGLLSLYQIYDLDLPEELTVLSACRTGLGRDAGDGIVSFARAFFFSGSRRIIYSLFSAEDESTSLFMASFYRFLMNSPDLAPATALRAARTSMWKGSPRWRDPSYWGAFTLDGEWMPILPAKVNRP
jgi:CHAT domain-containing protein/Tfp pilus assembly protein PilF